MKEGRRQRNGGDERSFAVKCFKILLEVVSVANQSFETKYNAGSVLHSVRY